MPDIRDIFLKIFKDLFEGFSTYLPKMIAAFIIFIIGWMVAKFVGRIIRTLLSKTKIDTLGDKLNEIDIVHKSNVTIVPSTLLSKVSYYLVMLVTLMASVEALGMPEVSEVVTTIINYIPKVISGMVMLVIGLLVAEFIKNIIQTTGAALGIPSIRLISSFVFYFIFLNVIMLVLGQLDIETKFLTDNLTMILGGLVLAFAFGYGFSSRDLMASFLASFYSKDKFVVGDVITIADDKGEIIKIDSTSVTLQTEDNTKIIIPLSKFASEKVIIHNR